MINVIVTYYKENEYFPSEYSQSKKIIEVNKLTDLNEIFKDDLIDVKVLSEPNYCRGDEIKSILDKFLQ